MLYSSKLFPVSLLKKAAGGIYYFNGESVNHEVEGDTHTYYFRYDDEPYIYMFKVKGKDVTELGDWFYEHSDEMHACVRMQGRSGVDDGYVFCTNEDIEYQNRWREYLKEHAAEVRKGLDRITGCTDELDPVILLDLLLADDWESILCYLNDIGVSMEECTINFTDMGYYCEATNEAAYRDEFVQAIWSLLESYSPEK